jgi:hypothetical protein
MTMTKAKAKRAFLAAVDKLESIRVEPEDVAALNVVRARKYFDRFDAQTSRVLNAAFRYLAIEKRMQ